MNWQPIDTAPRDGTEILLCMPGGQSDHFHTLCWEPTDEVWQDYQYTELEDMPSPEDTQSVNDEGGAWVSRYAPLFMVTVREINACHLRPMWCAIEPCPTSLSYP